MTKMRSWGLSALAGLLLLAACGGSDPNVPGSGAPSGAPTSKGTFTAIVSFYPGGVNPPAHWVTVSDANNEQ